MELLGHGEGIGRNKVVRDTGRSEEMHETGKVGGGISPVGIHWREAHMKMITSCLLSAGGPRVDAITFAAGFGKVVKTQKLGLSFRTILRCSQTKGFGALIENRSWPVLPLGLSFTDTFGP